MKNIVVFGGSFNPPTKAHLEIGLRALKFINADRLCFLPVGDKYNKSSLISYNYRVDMLNILKEKNKDFKIDVDLTEINSFENLSTIDSLNILQEKYKDCTLYFLLGADNLLHINEWKNPNDLLNNYKILAIKRNGYDIEDIISSNSLLSKYKNSIIEIDTEGEFFVSSTIVRDCILKDEDVSLYIEEEIENYIKLNNLYINK